MDNHLDVLFMAEMVKQKLTAGTSLKQRIQNLKIIFFLFCRTKTLSFINVIIIACSLINGGKFTQTDS